MQESFSRLWDGYESDEEAMQARALRKKELRQRGIDSHSFTLRNQLKKYDGLGQPNGQSCSVYMLQYSITAFRCPSCKSQNIDFPDADNLGHCDDCDFVWDFGAEDK